MVRPTLLTACVLALSATAALAQPAPPPAPPGANTSAPLQVGVGIYDITGPAGDGTFMGHVKLRQKSRGISSRLWARAFVFKSGNERLVFVSADLGMTTQAIHQGVSAALARRYPGVYGLRNVVISATHTHAGPGGYSHYVLYNAVSGGFDKQNFDAVVGGITNAVVRAHDNLAPARIKIATGELRDASKNRSQFAYLQNPPNEIALYRDEVDTTMTLLRIEDLTGREIGMLNWFPVHNTNVGNQNKQISGDNKGYASFLFEQAKGYDRGPRAFVAAFAQSNEGDSSPNLWGHPDKVNDYRRMAVIGKKQFDKAMELYRSATVELAPRLTQRQAFVNFDHLRVSAAYTRGAGAQVLGRGALGMVKVAGAPNDGLGLRFVPQGLVWGVNWPRITFFPRDQQEHAEKVLLLVLGMTNTPMSPEVLPVHLATIGSLAIVSVPFELTTMTGRRLREVVKAELAPAGIQHVVIAGLTNAYSGYITTREEYAAQYYEGSSTHFGPWAAAALRQEVHRLAADLRAGRATAPGPQPRVLTRPDRHAPPALDRTARGRRFGAVIRDAATTYRVGQTATAEFQAGHPRHDLLTMKTFLEVQQQTPTGWRTIATDDHPDTKFVWDPGFLKRSTATITWAIPVGTQPGRYRLVHHGHAKASRRSRAQPYTGTSRVFTVR